MMKIRYPITTPSVLWKISSSSKSPLLVTSCNVSINPLQHAPNSTVLLMFTPIIGSNIPTGMRRNTLRKFSFNSSVLCALYDQKRDNCKCGPMKGALLSTVDESVKNSHLHSTPIAKLFLFLPAAPITTRNNAIRMCDGGRSVYCSR